MVCQSKQFEYINSDGVNELEGLTLFLDVVPTELQDRLVSFAHTQLEKGKEGRLKGKTYLEPEQKVWAGRSKSRTLLQYGTYTYCNRVYIHVPVEPLPAIVEEVLNILQQHGIFEPELRPNACTINMYDTGQWVPAHVDNMSFSRPFFSVSLVSEQPVVLGYDVSMPSDGVFQGALHLPQPVGSVTRLAGNAADMSKHALPATSSPRISYTLRHHPLAGQDTVATFGTDGLLVPDVPRKDPEQRRQERILKKQRKADEKKARKEAAK